MRTPVYVAVALGLIAVMPWRGRRGVLAAAIVAPWAFTIGYVLIAPLGCTGTNAPTGLDDATTCASVLAIDYSGGAAYRPPLMPAVAAGLGLAAIALVALRVALRRRP